MPHATWQNLRAAGIAACRKDDYELAERSFTSALDLAITAFGEHDIRTACCHADLAHLLVNQRKDARAEQHLRRAIVLLERQLGKTDPLVCRLTLDLSLVYLRTERTSQAVLTLQNLLSAMERNPSADPGLTLKIMTELTAALFQQKRFQDARNVLTRIAEQRSDSDDPLTFGYEVAERLARRGDSKQAAAMARQVHEARLRDLGSDAPEVVEDQIQLAQILTLCGELADAEVQLRNALERLTKESSESNPRVAEIYALLADIAHAKEESDASVELLESALAVYSQLGDERATEQARVLHKLAMLAAEAKRLEAAEEYLERAVNAYDQRSTNQPLDRIAFCKEVADLFRSIGKPEKAARFDERVSQNIELLKAASSQPQKSFSEEADPAT